MVFDENVGGPCSEERRLIYTRAGMSEESIRHVERMVMGSPARTVGRAALNNVVSRIASRKNGRSRMLESHTIELVYAYELELDPSVIGYYTQVQCTRVERINDQGGRHFSSAHIDFLVFRECCVQLVECKPMDWLERKKKEGHTDWHYREDGWHHVAYEAFADQHELSFAVRSPRRYPGIYLQNLEFCYAITRDSDDDPPYKVVDAAIAKIAKRPRTLLELCDEVPGFDARCAMWMMGKRLTYGTWEVTPLSMPEYFTLFADVEQAELGQQAMERISNGIYAQSEITDPLLLASATDLARGKERLATVQAMERGEMAWTVRKRQLSKEIRLAIAEGRSALGACLTRYANSGNYLPRLTEEQEAIMKHVILRYWHAGKITREKDLYFTLKRECEKQNIECPGRTALYERLRKESPVRHALNTGGLRGYQAIRCATDPRTRSLTPIGYGHTLHIDSSKLDNKIAPDLVKRMPALAAIFYIGIDGATGDTMADALIFGHARTDGIAILLREYVRRHGRLPHIIHLDRGPENKSLWILGFAEGRITLRWSPTGGSAWNGLAENAIKKVNHNVAHQLIGSTEPDQKGRKVDGRFKSHRNAKTSFEDIRKEFRTYIYEDMPNSPDGDDRAPSEKREELLALYGNTGIPCVYDEEFLLQTSVEVDAKKSANPRRGVRTEDGLFSSDELLNAMRLNAVEELRRDCEDPTVLRVRIGGRWVKAFHSRVQTLALASAEDKLFELLYAPVRRTAARERLENIGRIRFDRLQLANFATANSSQKKSEEEVSKTDSPISALTINHTDETGSVDARRALWDSLPPYGK